MKIILAEHFGICFGVRDAIAQAEALAAQAPLTILGELVHNPIVRAKLRARGVKEGALDEPGSVASPNVLITAHGASDVRRKQWNAAGHAVADATCPLVRHAHSQLAHLVRDGFFPVVIGQPGHVEVRGLTEDFAGAVVIAGVEDIEKIPPTTRIGIISQTTQPIERVRQLVAEIRRQRHAAKVRFVDTVCKPTKDRQEALRRLIAETEIIVVVGGHASNNTRQLVEACRAAGRRAIHVECAEELRAADFAGVAIVGLTAGTSTLGETVQAVRTRLESLSA